MALTLQQVEEQNERFVASRFWECPEDSLDGWQPFTATLHHSLIEGPEIGHGQGITLAKDMVGYWCGARGGLKSLSLSYNLAKVMVAGRAVWTNYPISFFLSMKDELTGDEPTEMVQVGPCQFVNADGSVWYFESLHLDMDKLYTFSKDIRRGAVGITELQYFVESRTSGRYENRMLSYQLMQIRKTANSFFYDVQNPRWVDNRFGWSADFEVECSDMSKLAYDRSDRHLEEGEVGMWHVKDLSGVLTGQMFKKTEKVYGPFQFEGRPFWNIYPTHFIVDIFEALAGAKRDQAKKDAQARLGAGIADALNYLLDHEIMEVDSRELFRMLRERGVEEQTGVIGQALANWGITKTRTWTGGAATTVYHLDSVELANKDPEKFMAEPEQAQEEETE